MAISKGKSSDTGKTRTAPSAFTRFRKEWLEPIIIAIILVFLLKTFIIQNFKIPSSSMEDTLLIGDRLFASKFVYGAKVPLTNFRIMKIRDPKPGDIIVFKSPEDPTKDLIKRCIAIEGQTVEIRNKEVYVDGILQVFPKHGKFIDNNIVSEALGPRDNMPKRTVPPKTFFAMGDNRDNSYDSRYWGFAPYANLKGKALFIYWSIDPDAHLYDVLHKIRWNRLFSAIN